MRIDLLDRVMLICPGCSSPLSLLRVFFLKEDGIDQALLRCSRCSRIYPVINGIPVIIDNFGDYFKTHYRLLRKVATRALEDNFEKELQEIFNLDIPSLDLLSPKAPPEGHLNSTAYYLWRHYNDKFDRRDELEVLFPLRSYSPLYNVEYLLEQIPGRPGGVGADFGCSAGRFVFEFSRCCDFFIGLDRSFDYIDIAKSLKREGSFSFSLPINGSFRYEVCIRYPGALYENIDFLAADSLIPLLPDNSLSLALCFNLLTEVARPTRILKHIDRMLAPGGYLLLGLTYNWQVPLEDEILAELEKKYRSYEEIFRNLLFGEEYSRILNSPYEKLKEENIPFGARCESRSYNFYLMHFFLCRKRQQVEVMSENK